MRSELASIHSLLIFMTLVVLASGVLAGGVPEDCPEKPEDDESRTALASTWFKKAEKAYAEKKYDEAVSDFRCSLRMVEHPATYYNAAQAALMADDKPAALEFFQRNLELAPDGKSAAEVELEIADLEQELASKPAPETKPAPEVTPEPIEQPGQPETSPKEPGVVDEPDEGANPLVVTGAVLTGVGAAGVVTGVALQISAGMARQETEDAKWLVDYEDAESRMEKLQKGAYVGFIAGGALLVTGVILLAVGSGDEEQGGADVVLVPAPSGLVLTGRF